MNIEYTLFGRDSQITCEFAGRKLIRLLDVLKEEVRKPQILSYCGLETIVFKGYDNTDEPFTSCHDVLSWAYKLLGTKDEDIRAFLLEHSKEDVEWTRSRNKGYAFIAYRKITLGDELQEAILAEAAKIQEFMKSSLDVSVAEETVKKRLADEEKARLLTGVEWKTKEKVVFDEGGKAIEYIHDLRVDNEVFRIIERSVFDFGRIFNADRGGMYVKKDGRWVVNRLFDNEWTDNSISSAEQKAVEIVYRYGKYADSSVRM